MKREGKVAALFRYPQKRMPGIEESELVCVEHSGIDGDHHADGGERQISLLTVQEKQWMQQQEQQGFCFKKYRENILLDGLELYGYRSGDLIQIGDVVLELTGEIKSCHPDLCHLADGAHNCILAGTSRFAQVKSGGTIQVGMCVTISPGFPENCEV